MYAPKRYLEIGFARCVGWLDIGDDPNEWYLCRLDELCRGEKLEQSCDAESDGAC